MKIKVFTTDKDGKISFSKDELQEIINEAYWEGYTNGSKDGKTWTVSTPWITPYYTWTTTTNGSSSITLGVDNYNSITNNTTSFNADEYTDNIKIEV